MGDEPSKDSKDYFGAPPTAKEVTKSLLSAVIPGQSSSQNKLNSSDGYASQDVQKQQQKQKPAVEMPGDSLGRVDVQFGDLDLQFGQPESVSPPPPSFSFGGGPGLGFLPNMNWTG